MANSKWSGLALSSILVLAGLTACQTALPEDAMQLPAASLERRQMQVRRFDGIGETSLLSACAGVLQDLGFNLDESETKLGLIVASKERTATDKLSETAGAIVELLLDIDIALDVRQRIRVSLVTRPDNEDKNSHVVRVNFQRMVWNDEGEVTKREALLDAELYQEFFERLSKSVFLEAHKI